MFNFQKVVVGSKVDLDTIGVAYLFNILALHVIEVVRSGRATDEDLANPAVLCIEVGGAGRTQEFNFDHHDVGGPEKSATLQAFELIMSGSVEQVFGYYGYRELVEYIHRLDVEGPAALGQFPAPPEMFPTLSDVVSGMLLTERDPVEQLLKGVDILRRIEDDDQDPFGKIDGFEVYAQAKANNNRQIAEAVKAAQWIETGQGRKLGYLETAFFGAPGALYQEGAEIVVAYNPTFGNPPVPKFTVAGNSVKVNEVLPELNTRETGWGGPPTGTIVGSPREGSTLSLDEVVEIVRKVC